MAKTCNLMFVYSNQELKDLSQYGNRVVIVKCKKNKTCLDCKLIRNKVFECL